MARSEPAHKLRLSSNEADERLLIEAAQQDRARFADIYEKYFSVVYAFVAGRMRDRARAEDVTSEVFHKALANLPRFKWTGAPFGAWLLRIASNVISDRAKRSAKEQTVSSDESEAPSHVPTTKATQQATLEACERRARLFNLVEELAEDQRSVVVMRFGEEKSIREIAQALGRSEGAVKQLQFRALQNLRARLSK